MLRHRFSDEIIRKKQSGFHRTVKFPHKQSKLRPVNRRAARVTLQQCRKEFQCGRVFRSFCTVLQSRPDFIYLFNDNTICKKTECANEFRLGGNYNTKENVPVLGQITETLLGSHYFPLLSEPLSVCVQQLSEVIVVK